ncbi:MAG TPA: AAA-like domain-containing protein, partial [Thermoanaerobaculia bacterium]|nr:AAA-like domain-containing protein [Thermoanaerobaculia bacterium]
MSEPEPSNVPFYVTGGTLKPGAPSYMERQADTELLESLRAGEFCYVLTARQMGKSSLMARTAKRLEQDGISTAIVDLSQIGTERGDQAAAQWYFGIAHEIHRHLRITEPLRPWWQERADLPPVQRLTGFFRDLVLEHCPGRVVVFVDEIDSTIGLPFADDFFAALRACFNARATDASFERLTFALFGVASPDQLIRDQARTPFNIGKRIDLADFSSEEAAKLSGGLHVDPEEASKRLNRILHWTGGHPYLTQAVCRTVRERGGDSGTIEEVVDPRVEELFLSTRAQREETNLKHARARMEQPGPEKR